MAQFTGGEALNAFYASTPDILPATDEALRALAKEATALKAAVCEHALVTITDARGRIVFANDNFCAISKYSCEELLGEDHRLLNSGHHPKEFFRDLWRTITRGRVWHGDIKNRAKDNTSFWVATTIVPLLDERGNPRQFVSIRTDITERKRVEAELAEKLRMQQLLTDLSSRFIALQSEQIEAAIEATQRLIVETLGLDRSALWQLSDDGQVMSCTHCWQRSGSPLPEGFASGELISWARSRIARQETICFSRVDDLPPDAASDAANFRRHGVKSNVTFPLIANGQVFGALDFATRAAERNWGAEELAELKLIAQIIGNVIGRQRAELREEQLRGELAHAMRATVLGELTGALAHELNQPLAAILSNAQAARRFISQGTMAPNELRRILDDIVRDDKRAGSIIHNLRDLVSKRPADREPCCLNEVAREVIALMRSEMIEAQIEIRLLLAPCLPRIHAARVELQQVMVNLLVNAVHAMKGFAGPLRIIEVETCADGRSVHVAIRDRGVGISLEQSADIFDPFVSTKTSGLGMGLSICRRIIENHGGRIDAGNRDGGGASFSFALPIQGRMPK
jgi:PAS domain S-box-containing protein